MSQQSLKYYDAQNRRLIYIGERSSEKFWDKKWETFDVRSTVLSAKNKFFVSVTQRFLPAGSKILEGGCGLGDKVYSLIANGYEAVGVDFAEKTVAKIKEAFPELPVFAQDVTRLEFEDKSFDGYWSVGVIEHFKDGYDPAVNEMARVLKPNGVLFISFPWLSPLRAIKAALKIYPTFPSDKKLPDDFYQFALNAREAEKDLAQKGFSLLHKKAFDATLGLANEFRPLNPLFVWIYRKKGFLWRAMRKALDIIFAPFCGHSILLVFRKK